jgi:hypothetical protein
MEVSGIDDGFVHWFYHYEPSIKRLADYLDEHPEVDTILITEPLPGMEAGATLRAIRDKFPLLTTVAWGDAEKNSPGKTAKSPTSSSGACRISGNSRKSLTGSRGSAFSRAAAKKQVRGSRNGDSG